MMEQKLELGRLLRPKKDIVVTKDATDNVEPKRRTKTRKEISRDYRERMKDNPEMLKVHRDSEKKRFKEYYIRRSEEAVERNRQLQRERQQKYRERCKIQEVGRAVVRKTRQTLEEDRKRWREEKQLQRQNISRQKKTAEKKHRGDTYAAKKSVSASKVKQSAGISAAASANTKSAQRVANHRFKRTASQWRVHNQKSMGRTCPPPPNSYTICMCVCVCMYMCVCVCVYIYIYIYIYIKEMEQTLNERLSWSPSLIILWLMLNIFKYWVMLKTYLKSLLSHNITVNTTKVNK